MGDLQPGRLLHHPDDGGDAARAAGKTDIQTAEQAAEALKPIAGECGVLPVQPRHHRHRPARRAGAGGLGRLCRRRGARLAHRARAHRRARPRPFYAVIALAIAARRRASTSSPLDPIKALIWSAVLNGVIAVPIMAAMMIVATPRKLMGAFVAARWQRRARLGQRRRCMAAAAVAMFVLM